MTYLIPSTLPRHLHDCAHIERDGKPACGVALGEPFAVSGWLYAYTVCAACKQAVSREQGGQMGLFAETSQ